MENDAQKVSVHQISYVQQCFILQKFNKIYIIFNFFSAQKLFLGVIPSKCVQNSPIMSSKESTLIIKRQIAKAHRYLQSIYHIDQCHTLIA